MTTPPNRSPIWRRLGTFVLVLALAWWALLLLALLDPEAELDALVGSAVLALPLLLIGLAMRRRGRKTKPLPARQAIKPAAVTASPPRQPVSSSDLTSHTFNSALSGYGRPDVDRLLDRAAAALDEHRRGRDGSRVVSAREVEQATFPIAVGGVSIAEVDAMLSRVARTLREFERRQAARGAPPAEKPPAASERKPQERKKREPAKREPAQKGPVTSDELIARAKKRLRSMGNSAT